MTSGTLQVPGASLYYETRGSGPLLLILQGGDGDASGCTHLANLLAGRYTVVTYDRRGLSRSKIEDAGQPTTLQTHADDAHHLLAALTQEPALVFGGSLGALLGLDLVSRYPAQVRTLVAHEPPVTELLPEEERTKAVQSQVDMEETFRREGLAGAMKNIMADMMMDFQDREPGLELPQPSSARVENLKFFLTHDAPSVRTYRLDLAALKAASPRIVLAAGASSRDKWLYHSAAALAAQLGTTLVEFPGGHNGYILRPTEFASKLDEVMANP